MLLGWCIGVYTYANGDTYDGGFVNGVRSGRGTLTTASHEKYIGQWKNDQMNGSGIYCYVNGDKYNGNWTDSKRDKKGKLQLNQ